eukprot:1161698-Pelagomonas_calceolata.AAC.13
MAPVGSWQHAAPGHQNYSERFFSVTRLAEGMGSRNCSIHTLEDCVKSGLGTSKLFAQFSVLVYKGLQWWPTARDSG